MFDYMLTDNQIQAYTNVVSPIIRYAESHKNMPLDDREIKSYIPIAKQTDFILKGFLEIVEDLNYDKEKFENLIDTLDDDYEVLSELLRTLKPEVYESHQNLYTISNTILDSLVKGQFHLGAIISKNENKLS